MTLGDGMVLGMQDFDFAQVHSNLPKSNHFRPNFGIPASPAPTSRNIQLWFSEVHKDIYLTEATL